MADLERLSFEHLLHYASKHVRRTWKQGDEAGMLVQVLRLSVASPSHAP
jgi:phosphoribosyl-AMP cyclohydrolase